MTTPCLGNPEPYDYLIDHTGTHDVRWQLNLDAARAMCGRCPIRDACHQQNAGEPWVRPVAANPRTGTCERCSKTFPVTAGARRPRFCSEACGIAHRGPIRTLSDIPDETRRAHSRYVQCKSHGLPIEDDVRAGERAYQALRHLSRRARQEVAA